jgi:acyl-CoA synthetase (NDP forming)
VDLFETLIEIEPLLRDRRPPDLARAPRVAVLTTTGGGAAVVVDRLGRLGIELATPGGEAPIIDLTMGRKNATYGAVLGELLEFPGCDAVLAVVGSNAISQPERAVEPVLTAKRRATPLVTYLTPQADESLALLAQAGIAAFRTPEACADALHAFFSWKTPRKASDANPPEWPKDIPLKGKLTEAQALSLFGSLGMPVVDFSIASAPDFKHALAYPVVAKIISAEITHKSEAQGVALNIKSMEELRGAIRKLPCNPRQVLIQKMEAGLGEAIVGYRDDPVVGPLVMVGAGGILAELYNDVALRLAPVNEAGALEMIGQVKGFAALRGFRRLPPGDLQALARAVAALSRLALLAGRPVREAEANPVIVKGRGAVAVDALALLKE